MPVTLEDSHAEIKRLIGRFLRARVFWLKKHDKLEADNAALRGTIKKLAADLALVKSALVKSEDEVEALLRDHTDQRGR